MATVEEEQARLKQRMEALRHAVLNYTQDAEATAYTGIATGVGGTPYATVADLNALRVAYETQRAAWERLIAALMK